MKNHSGEPIHRNTFILLSLPATDLKLQLVLHITNRSFRELKTLEIYSLIIEF